MEPNPVAGSGAEIWKRQTRPTSRTGPSQSGQRYLLCGALGLRLETAAQRLWSMANRLWLLSALEPGLDLDIHPRHAARLAPKNRRAQRCADRRHRGQPIGENARPSGGTRL